MKMTWLVGVMVVLVTVGLVVPSPASVMEFFGEDLGPLDATSARPNSDAAMAEFQSYLVGVSTEDFESFANLTPAPIALTFGSDTATLSGSGEINNYYPVSSAGRFPTSGRQYWHTSEDFQIDFSTPQAAFGFYGTDIGDFAGTLTLSLVGGGTVSLSVPHTVNAPDASCLYYGVIATTAAETFTSVTFGVDQVGITDHFGFDDMTIGRLDQVDPVPDMSATLLLLGTALAGLASLKRRLS